MENKQIGCINRDKNAVLNMLKIVNHYMIHKKRPEKYCRTTKGLNPSNTSSITINEQNSQNVQGQVKPCLP